MGEHRSDIQYRQIEIDQSEPLPEEIFFPYSTILEYQTPPTGYPSATDVFASTVPALNVLQDLAPHAFRGSVSPLLLQPYVGVENRSGLTHALIYRLFHEMASLPLESRVRRVMDSLPFAADIDLRTQIPEGEFQQFRDTAIETLWEKYAGLPFKRRMWKSDQARHVLEKLGIMSTEEDSIRFRTKHFIESFPTVAAEFDAKYRHMVMVIQKGAWDGIKPFMDISFYARDKLFGKSAMRRLLSIGTAPIFSQEVTEQDTRRASWVLNWDRESDGELISMSEPLRSSVQEVNKEARRAWKHHIPHPERRLQKEGVFAQNQAVRDSLPPYMWRLKDDAFFHLPQSSIQTLIHPIHIPESITEQHPLRQFEQFIRAIRKSVLYSDLLRLSNDGKTVLTTPGRYFNTTNIAIDEDSLSLIRESVSLQDVRQGLSEMDPASRETFLNDVLSTDIVTLYYPFTHVTHYLEADQFKYRPNLSGITPEEWKDIYDALEEFLGPSKMYGRHQYIAAHSNEYASSVGLLSTHVLQTQAFFSWKNPYEAFVSAMRRVNPKDEKTQAVLAQDKHYFEIIEDLYALVE